MTGLATYTDAIVTLRPSQLQKLESLGLYYNSPEPAIICVECGFAINPTRAPRHPGDKHHITKSARRGLKPLIYSLNLPNPETLPLQPNGSLPHPNLTDDELGWNPISICSVMTYLRGFYSAETAL
ncbi:hypothetical protein QL093DRAFT_2595623 [Fusarium oxysporum]|nr:hypothetical protein QL093DRAFT_2595623 [Fusarium oxysporum]